MTRETTRPALRVAVPEGSLTELAWCAGFLDGEGWFGVGWDGDYPKFRCGANQVTLEPLQRLQARIGGSIYGPYDGRTQQRPNGQLRWEWRGYYSQARAVFSLLSSIKQEQIDAALVRIADQRALLREAGTQ